MDNSRKREWLVALALLAVTLIAYQPAWRAGFLWDDGVLLTDNPLIKSADGLRDIWASTKQPDYFPLTSTSFWLEWRLWGEDPSGYHFVNILLHAMSAVLLWRVLRRLFSQVGTAALLAAGLFALHPVNVASVAWISERKNTLAMLFCLVALLMYLRFLDEDLRRWYWAAFGAFALALLSKTAVTPLPLVLLAIPWWRRRRLAVAHLLQVLPFLAASIILGLVTLWFQSHRAMGPELMPTESFPARLAAAGWAVWFYLYKALLPFNLLPIYPRWPINASNAFSYAPTVLLVAALIACWRVRRQWGRALLFGLGYFVLMLLPVLGFFDAYFMRYSRVADHWQYLAALAPITLVAVAVSAWADAFFRGNVLVKPVLSAGLLLGLGTLTWNQAEKYRNVETLCRATLDGNPDCAFARYNLGVALGQRADWNEAISEFREAVEIQPDYADAYNNLGIAYLQVGKPHDATVQFQKAVEIQPGSVATYHYNLANALIGEGRLDEAILHFQKALAIEPGSAPAHLNLGVALLQKGRIDDAMAQYGAALNIQPDDANAHNNMAAALLQAGRTNEAISHWEIALKYQPDNELIRQNLASAQAGGMMQTTNLTHEQKASIRKE